MKTLKVLLATAACLPLLTACIGDETERAGFSTVATTMPYANVTNGMVAFATYGNWKITQNSGSDWCAVTVTNGNANMIYNIPTRFAHNTTGRARTAGFTLSDTNNSDVYVNFMLYQYATRGDGSMGNAALVRKIEGTDGSIITADYDAYYRPTALKIEKDGTELRNLAITYNDTDSTITVNSSGTTLKGKYDGAFQPGTIASPNDTVGYKNMQTLGFGNSLAFNVEERRKGGERTIQALLLNNQNLGADSEHVADSLRYLHHYTDGKKELLEKLKLSYSERDNRCQSLDANQLLLGINECNPYLLLSLYKYARNSKVVSEATTENDKYTVETTVNADGSINTMTVTRPERDYRDPNEAKTIYTFSYQ